MAQATGVPLDTPPTNPDAIQEFQFGAEQTMTAGITATQLVFSPSYFVGIQAAKAYASAMEAAESSSIADARRAASEAYAAALAADQNVAILREAEAHGARSIALPAIGCGVMGWTPSRASQLVLRAIGARSQQFLRAIDADFARDRRAFMTISARDRRRPLLRTDHLVA